eukprot:GEMP01125371.1.p1 GENE.GEMP01125371.1~~GEMP01125371.1.p1  ORF type:complete len:111 (-),score=6.36 GEMP01125371.1:112-444(-)
MNIWNWLSPKHASLLYCFLCRMCIGQKDKAALSLSEVGQTAKKYYFQSQANTFKKQTIKNTTRPSGYLENAFIDAASIFLGVQKVSATKPKDLLLPKNKRKQTVAKMSIS